MNNFNFLQTLFDPGEHVCLAENKFGVRVVGLDEASSLTQFNNHPYQFISLNALDGIQDRNPIGPHHATNKPRRADCNVTTYRNLLVELDGIPLAEQAPYIETLGMPWSTRVFSGGKSEHYIISLVEPVETENEYRKLRERIQIVVSKADPSTKNPSRLTRMPGHFREDKGQLQTLLEIRSRVTRAELYAWLELNGTQTTTPDIREPHHTLLLSENLPLGLRRETQNTLLLGAEPGERNNAVFRAACDLAANGFSSQEAIEMILEAPIQDFSERELRRTVTSAYQRVK